MIYREQKHAPATFPACKGCEREPMHVVASGRHSREPFRIGAASERHMIECTRCGTRTQLHETQAQALAEWVAHQPPQTQPQPLRVIARKTATA